MLYINFCEENVLFNNFSLCDQTFHKNACFRVPLYLWHNWTPSNLLTKCAHGSDFNVSHALACHTGGLTIIRNKEIHYLMSTLSTEVCHDIQPFSCESMSTGSSSVENNARLEIGASGFWGGGFSVHVVIF